MLAYIPDMRLNLRVVQNDINKQKEKGKKGNMKNTLIKIAAVGLFAVALTGTPATSYGADNKNAATAAPVERATPFHGKVSGLDAAAMSLSVGTRTFKVTPETKITLNGSPAKLTDAAVGDNVGGACRKADDGSLTATTLNFNTEDKKKASAPVKKEGAM